MLSRRIFVSNEVAATILQDDEDDWLFGGRSGEGDISSDNEEDDDVDAKRASRSSAGQNEPAGDDSDSGEGHHLDEEADIVQLARDFMGGEPQGSNENGEEAGKDPREVMRCGCSHECLFRFR